VLKNYFFNDVLKVNDVNHRIRIRIWIRIRIYQSEAWIRGSGSTPKCHGSGTLLGSFLQGTFSVSQDLPEERHLCCQPERWTESQG
jgi:hypothetical protein